MVLLMQLSSVFVADSCLCSSGRCGVDYTETKTGLIEQKFEIPQSVHLASMRAVAFAKLGARLGIIAELFVQVETLALLVAESLLEITADWHLVKVRVVGAQALFVGA